MTLYATPYSTNKRLTESYANIFNRVDHDEWACILDGDAMFTTRTFGHQIQEVIDKHGSNYKVLTCMTNRVANTQQVVPGTWDSNDISYHRAKGDEIWDSWFTQVDDITNSSLFSGVMILMQGKTWRQMESALEASSRMMLGVDNDIHQEAKKLGYKVGLMRGIYVMHYYRGGDKRDTKHLK